MNITFSFQQFAYFNALATGAYILVILLIIVIFIWFQFKNIFIPIYELEESINNIDVSENFDYKIPNQRNTTFSGLVSIINKILENTYSFIFELNEMKEELETSNEEISAAYEQIQASEEILKDQYDEIVEQKKHIEYVAFNDQLTGLLNRQGFINLTKKKLLQDSNGAIALFGIDNFKGINNTLGHDFGDKVLVKISEILKENLDSNTLISRFSGDEFIIYISECSDFSYIEKLVLNLSNKLKESLEVDKKRVYITTSIGISVYPNDSDISNEYIEIEVTENILIENIHEALDYLNKFKDLNISMALDDFGECGCQIAQGYYYSMPLEAEKIREVIDRDFNI